MKRCPRCGQSSDDTVIGCTCGYNFNAGLLNMMANIDHAAMDMPPLYGLIRLVAQIGAVLGCIAGVLATLGGLAAFQWGVMAGVTATSSGVFTII